MLLPMMMGYTREKVMAPVEKRLQHADNGGGALDYHGEHRAGEYAQQRQQEKRSRMSKKAWEDARGETALVMVVRPENSTPKPMNISPVPLCRAF